MIQSLRSTRLILRPYTPMLVTQEHVDWLNDKELMQYSEQRHHEHDLGTQMVYVRNPPCQIWLISCNGKDIGSISAYLDESNKHANLGILIGKREYHGQGFGAEAWTTVMEHLFENGCHKIEAGCREDNAPMRRLAVTTGMVLEAEIPGHFKVGDEYRALVLYGLFRADAKVHHSEWTKMWSPPYWRPGDASPSS